MWVFLFMGKFWHALPIIGMIAIQQGQVNHVFLKLLATLQAPVFLFAFTNDFTFETKYFLCANVGGDVQEFSIEENSTEDVLNGVVSLQPSGFWQYSIYEQSSTSNLDPANAMFLERGKVKVSGDLYTNSTFTNSSNTNSVYVN